MAEDIDANLVITSQDHRHYAANVHRTILNLDELHEVHHHHHHHDEGPPKHCWQACWHQPIKIRLAILMIFDIIISLLHFCMWYFLHGYEFFRSARVENPLGHEVEAEEVGFQVTLAGFEEATTVSTEDYTDDEIERMKFLSKFSLRTRDMSPYIEANCGETYYRTFLVAHRVEETRELCQNLLEWAQWAEAFYIIYDGGYLALMGLVDKHIGGKLLLIVCWPLQLIPFFMYIHILLLLNNQRFCIINYGVILRPQVSGTVYLLCVLIFYKLLFMFRVSNNYIKSIVHDKLFHTYNDSINDFMDVPGPRYHKFFSEKEAQDMDLDLVTEPGTYRLMVNELPFGVRNPPKGNVLPPLESSNTTSVTASSIPSNTHSHISTASAKEIPNSLRDFF